MHSITTRARAMMLAAMCLAEADPAAAQDLGTRPRIAGPRVQCMGIPAMVLPIADVGMARPGVIVLGPQFFRLPAPLHLFDYAHECAHHIGGSDEASADCWAVATGRTHGWFRRTDLVRIQQAFEPSSGDWAHAPGPHRVAHIFDCYDSS